MDQTTVITEVRPHCCLIIAHRGRSDGRWLFEGRACIYREPGCIERDHVCRRGPTRDLSTEIRRALDNEAGR